MLKSGFVKSHSSLLSFILRVSDAVLVMSSLFLCVMYKGYLWSPYYLSACIGAIMCYQVSAEIQQLYQSGRIATFSQEFRSVVTAVFWASMLLSAAVYIYLIVLNFNKPHMFSWAWVGFSNLWPVPAYWVLFSTLLLVLERICLKLILRYVRTKGFNIRRVAIIGSGALGMDLHDRLQRLTWIGYDFVGFFDDLSPVIKDANIEQPRISGKILECIRLAETGLVDVVYITLPMSDEEKIQAVLGALSNSTVSVYIVPDIFIFQLLGARSAEIGGLPAISIIDNPLNGFDVIVKRTEDILLGFAILLVTFVPMLLIGLTIKATSSGPVMFMQNRYGLDGRLIQVYKFRTMKQCDGDDAIRQVSRDDDRVTKLGSFLRRSSLDELPQFFNVIAGDMSIVGPRPHAISHNEEYRKLIPGYMLRHKIKPGITGWAQVNGWRGETDTINKMEKRIEYDHYYIKHWSLFFDLKIIAMTLVRGFFGKNAY